MTVPLFLLRSLSFSTRAYSTIVCAFEWNRSGTVNTSQTTGITWMQEREAKSGGSLQGPGVINLGTMKFNAKERRYSYAMMSIKGDMPCTITWEA